MRNLMITIAALLALALFAGCSDDDDSETVDGNTPAATSAEAVDSTADAETDGATDETFTSSALPKSVTVSPGAGFFVPDDADDTELFAVVQTDFPKGYIDFVQPRQVYNRASISESEVGDPPSDYVQWFNDNPFQVVTDSEPATVGGSPATRLTLSNPDNESIPLFELAGGAYDVSYQDNNYAYVVDIDDTQVLIICGTDNGRDFAEFQDACEAAVATVEFGGP